MTVKLFNLGGPIDLTVDQQIMLTDSFLELHPYLKSCYTIYHRCPKTELEHISIVFNFEDDKHLDLSLLSDDCKTYWSLEQMQSVFDKKKGEFWQNDWFLRCGIPPISRCLPSDLIKKMFAEQADKYHLEGSTYCFSPN